jgi:hypothetical protein
MLSKLCDHCAYYTQLKLYMNAYTRNFSLHTCYYPCIYARTSTNRPSTAAITAITGLTR